MKYNCDLVRNQRKPVILCSENGILHTYLKTARYETLDTVETKNNIMKNNLYIGFNPYYLSDVFGMVDTDYPLCNGKNSKSPLFIYGKEYSFLVLPVNIGLEEENMKKCMNRSRAA